MGQRPLLQVAFSLPLVDDQRLDVVPRLGALRVLEQRGAEVVLEGLAREDEERAPRHGGDALLAHPGADFPGERVGRALILGKGVERGDEAELVGDEILARVGGIEPVDEVGGQLLLFGGSLAVDRKEVFGADADSLGLLAVHADVDRHKLDVLLLDGVALDLGDLAPRPVAVLDHRALSEREFRHRVGDLLAAEQLGIDGRVVQIEVEDVLVVVAVLEGDLLGGVGREVDVVGLELIVDRQVGQVGLPAPVLAGLEGGGGEDALDAELVLLGGHVLDDLLELLEAADLIHRLGLRAVEGEILLHDRVVVDDAVALDHVGDADDLVAVGDGQALVGQVLVELGAREVGAVVLPVGVALGAVDLEEDGGVRLGDLGFEGLLVGARRGGHDVQLDARLRLVGRGDLVIDRGDLGLEVEVVELAARGRLGGLVARGRAAGVGRGGARRAGAAGGAAGRQRGEHRNRKDQCQ